MSWILQTRAYQDGNPEKFEEILKDRKINYTYVEITPFSGEVKYVMPSSKWLELLPHYEQNDRHPLPLEPNFFYGTILGHKRLGQTFTPNYCDFKTFEWSRYSKFYYSSILNHDSIKLSTKQIFDQKEWLFKFLGNPAQIFIRPNDNEKSFDGEVVAFDKIEEWYEDSYKWNGNKNIPALVSTVKKIDQEWRVIVSNGIPIASSQYRLNGSVEIEEGAPKEVLEFASRLDRGAYHPAKIFAMDICLSNGEFKLVEIGSIHTCGLYACDLEPIVSRIEYLNK